MAYYVYALHNGDGVYRYIGCTNNPRRRLNEHRSPTQIAKSFNQGYKEWLIENNPVHMEILEEFTGLEEALKSEHAYTEAYWSQLLNKAKARKMPTGQNSHWWGRKHSDEWKRKQSERSSGSNHPMWGRKLSPEERLRHGSPGVNHPNALFTVEDVLDIRTVYNFGAAIKDIARSYDVHYGTILRLVREKSYIID